MTSTGTPSPNWAAMTAADFDSATSPALPVPAGPVRIYAAQHTSRTEALFGDEPRPAVADRKAGARRSPGEGQGELFDTAR